ncbi:MAG TPA: HU family DNA-binding protein [Nevskia sp.]|jgi:DNA-binding protein HU-beta|nr:HU family DNA-binding protein [Nevskia sp.]
MTLEQLTDHLSEQLSISKVQAHEAVHVLTKQITSALLAGDRVSLPGLGSLSVGVRKARTGRNPRTGETIQIAARKVVKFSASSQLTGVLNPDAK